MTTDDRSIISAMKESRETGFRMLLAKYKEPVYWHIRRLVVSHADAQDAAQETFVRIFRSFRSFRKDSSLKAWIYRIATNEALRLLDRNRLHTAVDCADLTLAADEYVDYGDMEAVRFQNAILSLPTKQRLVFNLRYYDELGYDDIAAVMESTAVNVKANYHLAKNRIAEYINTHD